MTKIVTFRCDACSKIARSNAHHDWFVVEVSSMRPSKRTSFLDFTTGERVKRHVCSVECASSSLADEATKAEIAALEVAA